jgi:hypothetical protein
MSEPRLVRTAFKTSRLLDFVGKRELVAQTGHEIEDWPLVIFKELTDNAIDACEEAEIAPEIAVSVSPERSEIVVTDNGLGIPGKVIKDALDFSVRVSSREAYVSPLRGAQGKLSEMPRLYGVCAGIGERRRNHHRSARDRASHRFCRRRGQASAQDQPSDRAVHCKKGHSRLGPLAADGMPSARGGRRAVFTNGPWFRAV